MKLRLPLFFLIACVSFSNLQAQNLENPGDYMTAVSNSQMDMNKKYMAYMSAAAHSGRKRKVEKLRKQVLESITASQYKATDLPYYKGDNSLRQSSIDYMKLVYAVFNEDYERIVNMEDIAEQSFDMMQAMILLQEKTDEKLNEASDKIDSATKQFAAKYNVTIVDGKSDLGEKLSTAGRINKYRNDVYLLFFKSNWQDMQLSKAINDKKINDAEQARNALIKYSDEGLKTLDTMKAFNGDPSLKIACRQVLQAYKKLAENDIPKLSDYYLKEENFNKIKKSYESKSTHSKEEVDAYNKAVKEINEAVNAFNENNNKITNSRNEIIKTWTTSSSAFADNNMPHYK